MKLVGLNAKGWTKPSELSALVKVENLFGTPAQERRVTARNILRPTALRFSEFQGYSFYDAFTANTTFELDLEEAKTNAAGEADIALLLEEHDRASYQLALVVEAFEAGAGRGVTASANAVISPNDYLVGAKADGDLLYIKKNTERNLSFIAVNPKLEPIALNDLRLELIEHRYVSVLTKQDSGIYKYQSKLREVLLNSSDITIGKNGLTHAIDTKKPGSYKLEVKNKTGDLLYRAFYDIAGDANLARSLEKNAELGLKLSKPEYANGDEIEIEISAPYAGNGLITIEKDRVYASKWFRSTTTNSIQRITVPRDLAGNGYINVQLIRDFNSNEIFTSPLSYAIAPFKISLNKERSQVQLSATKLVKPSQNINFTVKTTAKERVVVFAVDEGILQAASYRLSNPLDFFFQKKALNVTSAQILDLILPEFSRFERLASAGGDTESEPSSKAAGLLNPFKRKVDKPVVFWSGITEVNGEKSFSYQAPDYFNGKLRVMAVAVSKERIGIAQTQTIVRDDFVLTPNVPLAVAPNDEFEITLGVSNNIEDTDPNTPVMIAITLEPSKHLTVVGEKTASITLAPLNEGFVRFKVKATDNLGGASLSFRARYEDKSSGKIYEAKRSATASVRPLVPFRVESVMGRMGGSDEKIDKFRTMFDAHARRTATLSHSPLILTQGLADYLQNYPHYCSEQLISGAFSALIAQDYKRVTADGDQSAPDYNSIAFVLQSRQNSNGAIGMWQPTYYGDPFITIYAAHYLIESI